MFPSHRRTRRAGRVRLLFGSRFWRVVGKDMDSTTMHVHSRVWRFSSFMIIEIMTTTDFSANHEANVFFPWGCLGKWGVIIEACCGCSRRSSLQPCSSLYLATAARRYHGHGFFSPTCLLSFILGCLVGKVGPLSVLVFCCKCCSIPAYRELGSQVHKYAFLRTPRQRCCCERGMLPKLFIRQLGGFRRQLYR